MSDSFGGSDSEFNLTVNQFGPWLVANGAAVGVSATAVTAITAGVTDWNLKYPDHLTKQTDAGTAASLKDGSRAALEALMRPAAKKVTVASDRTAAGLNEYAEARARVPVPTTRPVLMIDNSQRLQQTVNFRDEATPNSKKKPDGVMGCEIRCYVGDTPPADPEAYEFCGLDTSTPYLMVHDAADAKKNAYAVGRWVNTRGEKGPWSESVMATISA